MIIYPEPDTTYRREPIDSAGDFDSEHFKKMLNCKCRAMQTLENHWDQVIMMGSRFQQSTQAETTDVNTRMAVGTPFTPSSSTPAEG